MIKVVRLLGGWVVVCSLILGTWSLPAEAMAGPSPAKPEAASSSGTAMAGKIFLVDDFESGSLRSPREWWTFDIAKSEIASNKSLTVGEADVVSSVGNYSLLLQGPAKNWYAGGCGTYIAKERQELSKYNTFQMDVWGNGAGSGTLKIELYDDDNANWQCEQDPKNSYLPVYDDKWVYDVKVDWQGWKRISIPFSDFVDDNPNVGDDVWNPQQSGGSGGLLQLQFVCLGSSDKGNINFSVDNIVLTNGEI